MTATLNHVSYSYSQDIDALLVAPGGQTLVLVANLGPDGAPSQGNPAVSNSTLSDTGVVPPSGEATS